MRYVVEEKGRLLLHSHRGRKAIIPWKGTGGAMPQAQELLAEQGFDANFLHYKAINRALPAFHTKEIESSPANIIDLSINSATKLRL